MVLVQVAKVADIPEGEGRIVDANGQEIALFHKNGKFFAINNTCPHQGGPLGEGFLEDCVVTCPWHGWQFDVTSGESKMPPGMKIQTYAVEVKGDNVFVEIV